MVVAAPRVAPTRQDAAAAAVALIDAGAEEVLLFGSVARGEARPHSDIDLVAVFADLDYSCRHVRRQELQEVAAAATVWPVQLHLTDWPEWRARVDNVATSFERHVAAEAVVAATSDVRGPANWNKKMVLPMSDSREAVRQFDQWVLPRLREFADAARRGAAETNPRLAPGVRERARLSRMVQLCTTAALTAETSLKTLAVLYGVPTPTADVLRSARHDIARCLGLVPEPHREVAAAVLTDLGIDLNTLSQWRLRGTYTTDLDADGAIADGLVETYATMACRLTGLLAQHLQAEVAPCGQLAETIALCDELNATIAGIDVRWGIVATPQSAIKDLGLDL